MGFMPSILGFNSGNSGGAGMNFQAGSANITNPTDASQIGQAYQNSQGNIAQQNAFANALQSGSGQGIQNQAVLSSMLMNQAQGSGPNPAQLAYQENAQNIAKQQAGAIASTRGISPALAARMASQQGSGAMQAAAGQSATLQAQQQLAAQQQLGSLSGQQVGQYGGALGQAGAQGQNEQKMLLDAQAAYNNAQVASMSSQNSANAGVAGTTTTQQGKLLGGIGNALSGAIKPFANGGEVPKMAKGGAAQNSGISPILMSPMMSNTPQPTSAIGRYLAKSAYAQGGMTQPMNQEMLAANGNQVPGNAKVKGDSLKNDNVPAILSPKEIVLPRSVTMSKNAPEAAAKFVAAVLAQHKAKK